MVLSTDNLNAIIIVFVFIIISIILFFIIKKITKTHIDGGTIFSNFRSRLGSKIDGLLPNRIDVYAEANNRNADEIKSIIRDLKKDKYILQTQEYEIKTNNNTNNNISLKEITNRLHKIDQKINVYENVLTMRAIINDYLHNYDMVVKSRNLLNYGLTKFGINYDLVYDKSGVNRIPDPKSWYNKKINSINELRNGYERMLSNMGSSMPYLPGESKGKSISELPDEYVEVYRKKVLDLLKITMDKELEKIKRKIDDLY